MNRKKSREYERLLGNLRAVAQSEEKDWEESAWRLALDRATAGKSEGGRPAEVLRPRWAWAYAAVIVVLLGAAAVATRNFFHEAWPTLGARVEAGRNGSLAQAGAEPRLTAQNQLAVTFVSSESGLQVNWYFDKEFEWEEEP